MKENENKLKEEHEALKKEFKDNENKLKEGLIQSRKNLKKMKIN